MVVVDNRRMVSSMSRRGLRMAGLRAIVGAMRNVVAEVEASVAGPEAYVAAEVAAQLAVARESIHGL